MEAFYKINAPVYPLCFVPLERVMRKFIHCVLRFLVHCHAGDHSGLAGQGFSHFEAGKSLPYECHGMRQVLPETMRSLIHTAAPEEPTDNPMCYGS